MRKVLLGVLFYLAVVVPLAATDSRLTFVWGVAAGTAAGIGWTWPDRG